MPDARRPDDDVPPSETTEPGYIPPAEGGAEVEAEEATYVGDSAGGAGSSPTHAEEDRGPSMVSGLLVGLVIAVLVGWVPLVGPAAAGLAAGWFSRSRIRGMYASLLPGIVGIYWFWGVVYLYDVPFLSDVANLLVPGEVIFEGGSAVVFSFIFMAQFLVALLGGWIGGDLRERQEGRENRDWPRPA